MEIPVLIERVASNAYRVSSTAPFPFAVEGATKEEALAKARELMLKRTAEGAEVGAVRLGQPTSGGRSWAGYLKDDPLYDAWREAMAEHRRKVDAEEDRP